MSSLRTAVLAAAACLAAVVAPPAHAVSLAFTGIRPGTLLAIRRTPVYDVHFCTADFVFQDTAGPWDQTATHYIGTAGHCANIGERVDGIFVPPGSDTTVQIRIGTVVVDDDGPADFALIQIDAAVNQWVSPSMAHWGGPTGTYAGPAGVLATFVGHAGVVGGTVPRVALLDGYSASGFHINTVGAEGDSGGPVTTADGLAVGELTHILGSVPANVTINGTSIAAMLTVAGKALSTCASAQPWPLPGCPS